MDILVLYVLCIPVITYQNPNEGSRIFDSTNHSIVCIPPNTSTTKNGKRATEYSPLPMNRVVRTCAVI